MKKVTLVTPTYSSDYERFLLQRESIERCDINLPHVAIVNDEDLSLFRDMPFQRNLTMVSTREILPKQIEEGRKVWGVSRRNPRRWLHRRPIHGWGIQQLLKLASPKVVETEGIICLDSDTFFIDKVTSQDFFTEDNRLHLYETSEDVDAEMAEWVILSMRFLGVPLQKQPVYRYTHSPVPMHREILLEMQDYIAKRTGKPWMESIAYDRMIMEYSTYGVFARWIHQLKNVTPIKPSLSLYYWWSEETENLMSNFLPRISDTRAKIVLVNSNTGRGIDEYRALVEQVWSKRQRVTC